MRKLRHTLILFSCLFGATFSAWCSFILYNIYIHGQVLCNEPNVVIITAEVIITPIVCIICIVGTGLYIHQMRGNV
jgi:hypothetical protein